MAALRAELSKLHAPRRWKVPAGAWKGATAYILGGGKSLEAVDVASLRDKGRIVPINNAYKLAPWSGIIWTADARWIRWNMEPLNRFLTDHPDTLFITRAQDQATPFTSFQLLWDEHKALSRDPGTIAGWCSGAGAINLTYLYGATRIVLLGFDMRPVGNWHNEHKTKTPNDIYATKFIPYLERMARELKKEGVEVINATPGSGLTCFPIVHPSELGIVCREVDAAS